MKDPGPTWYNSTMECHHYCNEPLRCPTCITRFWKWAEARTNSKPPRRHRGGPSFYAHVNVVSPPVQVDGETLSAPEV